VLKNPRRPHRPLEVAMRMRDPFAVRAARAKDIVNSVLIGDVKSPKSPLTAKSFGSKQTGGGEDDDDANDANDLASERMKDDGDTSSSTQLISNNKASNSKPVTSKWHDIPSTAHKHRPKSAGSGPGRVRSGGASEEVVLLITQDGFHNAMKTINPNMKKDDVEKLFKLGVQEGLV
jgi:hypothetical protein